MSSRVRRRPFRVTCSCGHTWAPIYTPMEMLKAANILLNSKCPKCGAGSDKHFVATAKPSSPQTGDQP